MACGFCWRNARLHQQYGGVQLFLIERRPPWLAAFRARGDHPIARSLSDETAFKLGDCAEDMEHQLASRRRGVDLLFEGQERDALLLEGFDNIEKFAEGTSEAVEPNDGEGVAGANESEQPGEARTFEGFSRNHVFKDPERAGGFKAASLAGEVLIVGGDAGVADNVGHGAIPFYCRPSLKRPVYGR